MAENKNKIGIENTAENNDNLYSLVHDHSDILIPGETPKQKRPDKESSGFFKRHKKLWSILAIVFVILAIINISLSYLIVYSVNNYGSRALGTNISLGDVDLSLLRGYIGLKNLRIGNPDGLQGKQFASVSLLEFNLWKCSATVDGITIANPEGFRDKNILTLVEFSVKLKSSSLFGNKPVIENITVDGLDFYFEPAAKGKNNVEMLMDYIARTFQKKSEKKPEKDEQDNGKNVQIDNISLKNITLHAGALKEKTSFDNGIAIRAEKINILLNKGVAEAENITITNPPGYFETNILTLKQIKAALDTESFSQEKLRIRKFHINDLDFFFEASIVNGNTNIGELQAYINTTSNPGKGDEKDEDKAETKLQIDDLSLTNIDVHAVIIKQDAILPIPDIIQRDLGTSPEGITATEIFLAVLEDLANESTLVIAENAKKFGNDIKNNAKKTIEQGRKDIKKQINSLKSLFR